MGVMVTLGPRDIRSGKPPSLAAESQSGKMPSNDRWEDKQPVEFHSL